MQKTQTTFYSLILLLLLAASVSAQSQTQNYWHTSDYYSVQLNGAGDAFVSEQVTLQSISNHPVNVITLVIPYLGATLYQVIGENASSSPYYYPQCIGCMQNYNVPYFINYSVSHTFNSTILRLNLNEPLENSSQTTIYLFFSAPGVSQKVFQGHSFSFKTTTDPNALIREAYASVEIPQNMNLKGEPSFNITYQASEAQSSVIGATSALTVASALPSIFYYGQYQYQASNLLPGEFFTINGLFGTNLILLYLPEILVGIIIAIAIILLFKILLWPKLRKMFTIKAKGNFTLARPTLAGAVSGFLFQVTYYAVQVLYAVANGYYYYNSPLAILLFLLSFVVVTVALLGLPYQLYTKFGKREGVLAGIASIVFAIVYSVIILLLLPPRMVVPFI